MKILTLAMALTFGVSCATRRPGAKVPPPASTMASRVEYVDLLPQTELHILTAYFKEGAPRTGIEGYLGTESADYRARVSRGLQLVREESQVATHPADQPPARELIPLSQRRHRKYRFYYAVVFARKGSTNSSVLLGANSQEEIERLGTQLLADPDSVCAGGSPHCTIFPKTTTVSVAMQIFVNGTPKIVQWRTILASLTPGAHRIEVTRRSATGRVTATMIDMADPAAVRSVLLPGDQVKWE
jgi:hypothetical protein